MTIMASAAVSYGRRGIHTFYIGKAEEDRNAMQRFPLAASKPWTGGLVLIDEWA